MRRIIIYAYSRLLGVNYVCARMCKHTSVSEHENNSYLLTFEDFLHATYCQAARAQDDDNVDNPEEAKESGGNEAVAGTGNGFESDKAGDKSDLTVEVRNEPVLEAKGKRKASESVGVAKSCKNGAKCIKVTIGKPAAKMEVKAKPAAKTAAVKTPAKDKTPPKSPLKKK